MVRRTVAILFLPLLLFPPRPALGQDRSAFPPPVLTPAVREAYQTRLAEAQRAYEHTPNDPDSIIWLGRRTGYLGGYREAIAIFTEGISKHPSDPRMYRHRGHRYITIRDFGRAIADLERGMDLVAGKPDQVEPDGIPNARGIPTSTLHSNLRYHLGLAYYLEGRFDRAADIFRQDVEAARARDNSDMLVASSHWLYMALRRNDKPADAALVLQPITADLPVIENGSYHRLLLLYQGKIAPDSLLPASTRSAARGGGIELRTVEDVTLGYGLGNWHLYNGRIETGRSLFRSIVASPQWAAFGYVAAEADLKRAGT